MTKESQRIEVIEERLHGHERELSRTLEAIRDHVTSRELVGELYDRARASGYPQALGRAFRDNPIPTVLAGVCAAWLAKSARDAITAERRRPDRGEERPEGPPEERPEERQVEHRAGSEHLARVELEEKKGTVGAEPGRGEAEEQPRPGPET